MDLENNELLKKIWLAIKDLKDALKSMEKDFAAVLNAPSDGSQSDDSLEEFTPSGKRKC